LKSIDPETKNEITILRRSNRNDDDEHHGGVWKIAYADFMTAMMAFFLVMWLLSSINEDTKNAIASYFNPIKLVDSWSRPRGIEEVQAHEKLEDETDKNVSGKMGNKLTDKPQKADREAGLMRSPYQALDMIAGINPGNKERREGFGGVSEGGSQQGSLKGTAYRDPFSPEFWKRNIPSDHAGTSTALHAESEKTAVAGIESKTGKPAVKALAAGQSGPAGKNGVSGNKREGLVAEGEYSGILKDISSDIAALVKNQTETEHPSVRVSRVKNEIAVELTDNRNYGMFAVGSANPDKHLVELLEGVAKILQKYKGKVIISGYTDARPYKTLHYDNWQLSAARAQMAYYMLVRGGLDEKRVLRVEGYADRDLKNSKDSYAAENRRIAIFLRLPGAGSS